MLESIGFQKSSPLKWRSWGVFSAQKETLEILLKKSYHIWPPWTNNPIICLCASLIQERLNLRRCLLHGVLRVGDAIRQPKSATQLFPSGNVQMNATINSHLQAPVASENFTNISNSSIADSNLLRMRRTLGRSDDLAKFAVPAAIRLASKLHKPRWHVGFCLNGHAFANRKPYAENCPSYSLSKRWSLLYICPPVPSQCRIPECKSETRVYDDHAGCPHVCRSSIFCGDMSDRVGVVHP